MAEKATKLCGAPPAPIRCASCPMMKMIGRSKYTGNNDHLSRPRGICLCGHKEADAAFRLISPRASSGPGFIAYTKGDADEPDIKTAPRWCPRKIASEPRKINREDASTIIESRHPYGLFFLKDGGVYVGIDNRDGDAWTEEFPTKRKCLEWLTDAAYKI